MSLERQEPILQMKGICKYFGGVHALENVDFELYTREILALVGDNGAGKTTLIKVISGVYPPDKGEIYLWGNRVEVHNPREARRYGIETLHQDLGLVECRDVVANVFLGREIGRKWFPWIMDRKVMEKETARILDRLHISIPFLKTDVENLSGGERQALAVGRAISWGHKIIIMDEPAASLGVEEARKTLALVKELKKQGGSIIIISHNLGHVFSVADRVFVLRRGEKVGCKLKSGTTMDEIFRMIIGAEQL